MHLWMKVSRMETPMVGSMLVHWIEAVNRCLISLNFVSSPVREGNKALRFELRQSDPDSNIGSKRIQLEGSQGAKAGKREVWHSFSIFLPNDYTKDPSSEILWEMHSIPDGFPSKQIEPWRSAPLELMTENGGMAGKLAMGFSKANTFSGRRQLDSPRR